MELKDLNEGEYYHINFFKHNTIYINKSNGGYRCGIYLNTTTKTIETDNAAVTWRSDIDSTVRTATTSEIRWLNSCIRKGSYVERPTILNIYGLIKK